jgi:dihydroorotase
MDHAQDQEMERRGVMHEGAYSRAFGLPGIPSEAEAKIVRRDVDLAEQTGCRVHIQHMTSREAVDILEDAKARGVPVTGEVSPHHLMLCDADIDPADANYKMNPPLRSADDRERLMEGIRGGIADIFATDHAPHTAAAKQRGFLQGPFGVVGLETAIGVTYTRTVATGILTLKEWIERWTIRPAAVLGLAPPSLRVGEAADIVVLDVRGAWTVDREGTASRSRNTPFHGRALVGRAACTILGGRLTWRATV